ncbi:MAG: nucleotidyltransferase family protein [Bacteroidota bacterium]
MLTAKEIEAKLREMKPFLAKQFKVKKIGYFGSFVTGEATEESDIDILVDFSEPPGYEFFDLEDLLEGTFHRKIDLVSKNALHKYLKDKILNETIYV